MLETDNGRYRGITGAFAGRVGYWLGFGVGRYVRQKQAFCLMWKTVRLFNKLWKECGKLLCVSYWVIDS